MLLKPGKLLKAICKGAQIGFTLDEPAQGRLAAKLAGSSAQSYCFEFGGTVKADTAAGPSETGTFKATDAPPPPACPLP